MQSTPGDTEICRHGEEVSADFQSWPTSGRSCQSQAVLLLELAVQTLQGTAAQWVQEVPPQLLMLLFLLFPLDPNKLAAQRNPSKVTPWQRPGG